MWMENKLEGTISDVNIHLDEGIYAFPHSDIEI